MKKRGFKPNPQTYTILLKGCANNPGINSDRLAQKLIEYAKKLNEPTKVDNEHSDIVTYSKAEKPGMNIIHYNNLLNMYSKNKQLAQMIELYDQLREQQPLLYQLYGYKNRSHIDDFDETLDPKNLIVPDIFSYTTVINGLATVPSSNDAFEQVITIWLDYKQDLENYISFEAYIQKNRRNFRQRNNPLKMKRSKYSLDDVVSNIPKLDYKEITQRNMRFDSGLLLALMKSSSKCDNREYLFKGLELIESAFNLNLNISYPTTESYKQLPKLDIELEKRHSLQMNPSIFQIALQIQDKLGLHDAKLKLFSECAANKSLRFKPDLFNFYNIFSSITHQLSDLVKQNYQKSS
jgi:pentatricopeptide repeat protein